MSSLFQPSFPTSLTTLPTELSLATAKYLDPASLKSLASVNRKMNAVASSVLFSSITLGESQRSVRAFKAISESELVGLVKVIHLRCRYETAHFRKTSLTGALLVWPSSMDTVLSSFLPLLPLFTQLQHLDITSLSSPLTFNILSLPPLPVQTLDLTGSDLSSFPSSFWYLLEEVSFVKVVSPSPRFVGPVDFVGRRRVVEFDAREDSGRGLRSMLRRNRGSVNKLDVRYPGVALDLVDGDGRSNAKRKTEGAAGSVGPSPTSPIHYPLLKSFRLTPTNLLNPTTFLSLHSTTLESLTIYLPLPTSVAFPPQLPSLRSLAFLPSKHSPGLTISEASALFKSIQGRARNVVQLSVTVLELDVEVLRLLVRSFPKLRKLELRSPDAQSCSLGSPAFYLGSLSAFITTLSPLASLTSLSFLGCLTWPKVPCGSKEKTVQAYASKLTRLETLTWTTENNPGSHNSQTESWGIVRGEGGAVELRRKLKLGWE